MSQTETLMLLALGAVLTLVCVLLFARSIWNLGQRMARRRADKNRPTLIRDLEADRDQLRASHAMLKQKVEVKLAEANANIVEQQAEVSRHRNRVQSLIANVNEQQTELESRDTQIADLKDQVFTQSAEIDNRDETIAGLHSNIDKLEDENLKLKRELAKTAELFGESSEQLQRLEAELASTVIKQRQQISPPPLRYAEPVPPILPPPSLSKPDRQVMMTVNPTELPRPKRYDFEPINPETGPADQRSVPRSASELSDLINSARRSLMANQDDVRARESKSDARSNAIANVISIAQRIKSQGKE